MAKQHERQNRFQSRVFYAIERVYEVVTRGKPKAGHKTATDSKGKAYLVRKLRSKVSVCRRGFFRAQGVACLNATNTRNIHGQYPGAFCRQHW